MNIGVGIGINTCWIVNQKKFPKPIWTFDGTTDIGTANFSRYSTATVTDFEGNIKSAKLNEARFTGARRVENLVSNPEQPSTQTIEVEIGGKYQARIGAESISGATVTFSGAFSDILTADGANAISFPDGEPKTATTTSLTCTIDGDIKNFMLENVTGQINQKPSNFTLRQWQSNKLNFDGVDDWIYLPIEKLPYGSSEKTISLWTKIDSIANEWRASLSFGTPDFNNSFFFASREDKLYFGGYGNDIHGENISIGDIVFLAGTYNGTITKFYTNGTLSNSDTKNWNIISDVARIGQQSNNYSEYWHGDIWDVRIYNKELQPSDIQNLWTTGTNVTEGLVRHYLLNEKEGEIAYDISGNNHHGVLKNFNLFPKYYSTENSNNVDENGIIIKTQAPVIAKSILQGILLEKQRTNLFLNSNSPLTQNITISSGTKYTASVKGIAPETKGWIDAFATIRKASDVRYRPISSFIVSPNNADAYNIELGKMITGSAIIADTDGHPFLQQNVASCRYMPDNAVMYTPLKNLVMGISTIIRRDSAYHARKRVLELTYDMAVDFELAIKKACVLATTA